MQCPYCKETIADGALKCKHCGSMLKEEATANNSRTNVQCAPPSAGKFNLMGLLFCTSYYAGYGKVGKGLVCAAIGFLPITLIPVAIYMGFNANKELPVGSTPFSWGKAIGVGVFQFIFSMIGVSVLKGMIYG